MRNAAFAALAAASISLLAGEANAQAPDKRGFNFNVAGCPTSNAGLQTVNYNKFTDGSALPMCSATVGTTRYAFVWVGYHWAVYGPSTTQVQPIRTTPMPSLPVLSSLPAARYNSAMLYKYGTGWYQMSTSMALNSPQAQKLITDCGGHVACHDNSILVTSGGNLVNLRLIGSDSAGVVGPSAGTVFYSNPAQLPAASLVSLSRLTTGHASGSSLTYFQYNNVWYSTQVIAAGGGNLLSPNGGNIYARDDHGAYYQLVRANVSNITANVLNNPNILGNQHNNITINQGSNLRR